MYILRSAVVLFRGKVTAAALQTGVRESLYEQCGPSCRSPGTRRVASHKRSSLTSAARTLDLRGEDWLCDKLSPAQPEMDAVRLIGRLSTRYLGSGYVPQQLHQVCPLCKYAFVSCRKHRHSAPHAGHCSTIPTIHNPHFHPRESRSSVRSTNSCLASELLPGSCFVTTYTGHRKRIQGVRLAYHSARTLPLIHGRTHDMTICVSQDRRPCENQTKTSKL